MKTGIYMIRNKVNDKKYIGQAVDIDKRWREHIRELNDNKHRNQYLQNAWNRYGADNFEFTIVCLCKEEELNEFEIDMIAHYHAFYKYGGYNLTLGGDGCRGYKFTDEQRAKMSEARKEYLKDPKNRKNMSETLKEYYKDPGNRKKLSDARKEYYKDPETRKKKSEAWKGDKNPMKRPETRKKASEAGKGKGAKAVYCVTNDTVYAGVREAGKKLGIDIGYISWCCNGKNILHEYPDGHHKKKGLKKESPVYEFWFLSEYEEKFGKVAM